MVMGRWIKVLSEVLEIIAEEVDQVERIEEKERK